MHRRRPVVGFARHVRRHRQQRPSRPEHAEAADTGVEEEVRAVLDDLADDQLAEVLAMAWVGRGTYDATEWEDAFAEAGDLNADERMDELMDMPLLASHLEAGLAAFDFSCDGVGQVD